MENKISILHLEDQEADSFLIKSIIGKWFNSFDYYFVDDEPGFIQSLKEKKIDIILSDFEIPGYSGSDALLHVRKHFPNIPFIFVTGKMGEDSAIESLLNGATDYVLKSKLERLVPSIKRVLHETELLKARIAADQALRESEERYRGLLMNLDAGVVVHTPDTSIIMSNPKAGELLGLTEQQMFGVEAINPIWHFLHEDGSAMPFEQFPVNQIVATKKPVKDFRLGVSRPESGDVVWLTVNGSPVFGSQNEIVEIVISFLDITERKQAEDELRKEQNLMEILMENIPDHLYFKDLNSRFLRISKSNNESFGLSDSSEAIGKTDFDFFTEEHALGAYLDEQEIIRTGKPIIKEEKETWADRPDTWAFSTKMPLRNQEGEIIGTFGISRDISDRKHFEEELLIAKEKAEASDKLKTAFLRNISHEIRTPLNGILGFGLLMSDPDLSPAEKDEFLIMVNESSDRLINTIANIMDAALIVTGNQTVQVKKISLDEMLREIVNKFQRRCIEKKLAFSVQKDPDLEGVFFTSDPEILNKVLNHLIGNAIKFTKEGSIQVVCTIKKNAMEFTIRDSGIGIPAGVEQQIFEHFIQGDTSNTRDHEGSGLGLSIAKGLVDLLQGRIWVESTQNEGSSFIFSVPADLTYPQTDPKPAKKTNPSGKPLVLVADDEPSNCVLLKLILEKMGIEVIVVSDGQKAVEACRSNSEISLVLMDMKMPVMDGFTATTVIKGFRPQLPIIALTAFALRGDEKKAQEAGCDDYLTKPLRKELLTYKLLQYGIG